MFEGLVVFSGREGGAGEVGGWMVNAEIYRPRPQNPSFKSRKYA